MFNTVEGYHDTCGGYHEYYGGVQYYGGYLLLFEYLHGTLHPHGTHDIPMVLK